MDITMAAKIPVLMRKVGITPNLLGWKYINSAVILAIEDPMAIDNITRQLYPTVAKMHNSTPSRVERAIRHAIENAFCSITSNIKEAVFGHTGKTSNKEFIAALAQVVAHEPDNSVWSM